MRLLNLRVYQGICSCLHARGGDADADAAGHARLPAPACRGFPGQTVASCNITAPTFEASFGWGVLVGNIQRVLGGNTALHGGSVVGSVVRLDG
jgi:hypothetical protein